MSAPQVWRLVPHPARPSVAVSAVDVRVGRAGGALRLDFLVSGAAALVIPPPATPARADELWRTTCFELFVRTPEGGYCEFNFSPSGRWAAYRFAGYRAGMAPLDLDAAPVIVGQREAGSYRLEAQLTLPAAVASAREIGLSAVIEEAEGARSFWALAHGADQPDFHDPACFTAELPAASAP